MHEAVASLLLSMQGSIFPAEPSYPPRLRYKHQLFHFTNFNFDADLQRTEQRWFNQADKDHALVLGELLALADGQLGGEKPDPARSDCHAWSASPVYELLATVCGIEPASPGFATVRIEPHLGPLQQAAAKMPHPRGEIAVSLRREGPEVAAEISLPEGVSGTLVWSGKTVELHGGAQTLKVP